MKVVRFHHVSVNTAGTPLPEVVSFYRNVLGLADQARPDIPGVPGHWLTVADQELHLVGASPCGTAIDPIGNHYCIGVDDLDAAVGELEALGIEYVREANSAGTVQVWITDPAGNTVELQQDKKAR
jgi:catechol 2,3-dioxygenase-like lactoylglutathione lyase family enzyme